MAEILFGVIVGFTVFEYVISLMLDYLNQQNWSDEIPGEMKGYIDQEKYAQSQQYDKAKMGLGLITSTFGLTLILLMLFFDGFTMLDNWVRGFTEQPILMALLFFGILYVVYDFISLPFSIYDTFVTEEKFGFNKTTMTTFITDKLKGYLVTIILGGGILSLIILFYQFTGVWFWFITWVAMTVITLFFTMFYTSILVPIFNKLTPLEEGELRTSINDYAEKVQFPLKNVMVIDGSKRSTKANAYFSGIGSKKTIVLYDTLINNHTIKELVAVIAHEVGHYKKKHIQKGFMLSTLQSGVLLYLFGWIVDNPLLAEILGAEQNSFHLGLLAFSLLLNPISFVIGILMNMYSRKNEFEADNYAKETSSAGDLKLALKKLSVDSLSNLRPHPAYVFFHYSHPPMLERLKALG